MSIQNRFLAVLALSVCTFGAARASLVYYLPFELDGSASLANQGTAGGTANAIDGPGSGSYIPASSTLTAPGIGGTHSESFPGSGTSAGAVELPGSTNQFNLDSAASKMTLSTWVYWNGALGAQEAGIATKVVSATTTGWGLSITQTGGVRFEYGLGGSGTNRKTADGSVATGAWTHVAVSWDTGSTNALRFYVNGALTSDGVNFTGPSTLGANTSPIYLGVTTSTLYRSLNGNLDDFAMWDSVLTAAQIRALNTTPDELNGYNASFMNQLFNVASGSISSATLDGLTWTSITGLDVSGRTLGDTWTDGEDYFIWLSGSGGSAAGLIASAIPEPGSFALLAGLAGLAFVSMRRNRRAS
ncbi:MAG: LamG domain-containing protein [Verrucomicrobiota bacterium]